MVKEGILPPTLKEMTNIIRDIGNIGAHADKDDVTISDVEEIDDFFQFIIEYVYVAPAKIEKVKFNLDLRKLISEYGGLISEVEEILMISEPRTPWELDYYEDEDEDSHLPYEYEKEAVLIVKKLKDLQTKVALLDFVCEELGFSFIHLIQENEFVDPVWDLWNKRKK